MPSLADILDGRPVFSLPVEWRERHLPKRHPLDTTETEVIHPDLWERAEEHAREHPHLGAVKRHTGIALAVSYPTQVLVVDVDTRRLRVVDVRYFKAIEGSNG